MSELSFLSIDNYYPNADEIRNLALSLEFRKKNNADYPGVEAYIETPLWLNVKNDLKNKIEPDKEENTPNSKKDFLQGKFRLALKNDDVKSGYGVHQDQQKYSAIIYLSENAHCKGGIGIYKCAFTGETKITKRWLEFITEKYGIKTNSPDFMKIVKGHFLNWDNWELYGELPMRYNRAIILMAHCFHTSTGIFGEDKFSGRLTQHFEFYL